MGCGAVKVAPAESLQPDHQVTLDTEKVAHVTEETDAPG